MTTTFTRAQTLDLLSVIAAYDRRTIGEGDIAAWSEAARRAGWRFPDAVDAVHSHFAESTAWLMPGHVTTLIRASRRRPAPVDEVLSLSKPVASEESRARFMEQIRGLASRKGMGA